MNRTKVITKLKTRGLWDRLSSRQQMVMEEFVIQRPDKKDVDASIDVVYNECKKLLRDSWEE